jgi:RNA polymerase-interacting CarD/CdnL/TRCF family regulator
VDVTAANTAEELEMQFEINDVVVHPAYGIGQIAQITEKQFSRKNEARLYYLITMPNRNTLWIPVEDHASNGLRLVTARCKLDQYRALLKSRPANLEKNHRLQHLELVSRLKQGSFKVMCEVVRDLTISGWQKPLGVAARAILEKTQQRLCQEWASSADISIAEATREIRALLQATPDAALS